jgi:hypothetical protein
LFHRSDLETERLASEVVKFLMIVVIAVNADGKPLRMASKERNNRSLATIVIPRDESDGCVKVVFFHLPEEIFID